jgi:hypothetical protein
VPKVNTVTKEAWSKHYDPMHDAFQALFRWHMSNAPTMEEAMARIQMDLAITVVNLFVVNARDITPRILRSECLTVIENLKRCIENDDLIVYCLAHDGQPVPPSKLEENQP